MTPSERHDRRMARYRFFLAAAQWGLVLLIVVTVLALYAGPA